MKIYKQHIFFICSNCLAAWIAVMGFFISGCENPVAPYFSSSPPQDFAIQRVRISALTDFVVSEGDSQKSEIKTFAELLDAYDSQLKKLCVFRFELYDYKPLSSNPRGKRLVIWPDYDLTDPTDNNQHWKDYLRSYEFYLPLGFSPQPEKSYLLEVTCSAGDRRFNDVAKIQFRP